MDSKRAIDSSSLPGLRLATVSLVASFAVLVIVASAYNLFQQYRVVMDTTARIARDTVDTIESHAAQTLGETLRIMEGVGEVYEYQLAHPQSGPDAAIDERFLHELMAEKLRIAPAVLALLVLDEKFAGVAGSRTLPVDLSRVYLTGISFESAVNIGDGMMLGKLFKSQHPESTPNSWILPVGVQVKDTAGALRGYVFALVDPQFFAKAYAALDIGAHGRIAIWTADDRLVSATANEKTSIGELAETSAAFPGGPARAAKDRVMTFGGGLMHEVVAAGDFAGLPFLVTVVLETQDFLGAWRNARNAVALSSTAVMLVMAAFGMIMFRQISHAIVTKNALHQAKAAAEEASDAKGRFLAHMSHEFRTPLNAIMGFSEIIRDKIFGGEVAPSYTAYAELIHSSGKHLLQIVNDILDMAKIESGAQPVGREPIDVAALIAAAVSFVEALGTQANVKIRIALPAALPAVLGDQRFSRQVLINLLSNAIKFSPSGGEVVVAARHLADKFLDISVVDHGPGIEPEILERLGEPFLQGNPAVSRQGQGTGLGLSICKRYIDILGGSLVIESTLGTGTTAIIRFPAQLLVAGAPGSAENAGSTEGE